MKKVFLSMGVIAALLFFSSFAYAQPSVTILANSIDLSMNQGYIDNMRALGVNVTVISMNELRSHTGDSMIFVLGGQNAPERVGDIPTEFLTGVERNSIISSPDASRVFVVLNPWKPSGQTVIFFAGYGKEQTRQAFAGAQGDLMKILLFNESLFPQNNSFASATIPPIDPQQPFTDVTAYEANAIRSNNANLVVIDVRGKALFDAGHIPGAIDMPVRDIMMSTSSLAKDKTYILYCGGNSESMAAGRILAANGFKSVYRIVDGYMAWRRAGYPREVTP